MTETASVASVNTPDAFRFGCVGRPLPGVQMRIADDDSIVIKGPNIFNGYYRDADATRETVVGGWLHTGNLGPLDENGFLYITCREKDIIITTAGGKNIAPANLEHALQPNRWISHAVVLRRRPPKEGYRARYGGGLFAAPELPGVAPPLSLVAVVERGGLVHA